MNLLNNSYIEIKIEKNPRIIKLIKNLNINIYNVVSTSSYYIIKINSKDYKKIQNIIQTKIIKEYSIKSIIKKIKSKRIIHLINILLIINITIASNYIVKIDIITKNTQIKEKINDYLDKNNIKILSKKLNNNKLEIIKQNIEKEIPEIEWLNIESKGMKYIINVEENKEKNKNISPNYCHITSRKEGIITNIINKKGESLKEINDKVNKDEIIISGDITYNNEIKNQICADGKIYADTWYKINIEIPKYKTKIKYLSKERYNILIKYKYNKYRLFKNRIKDYKTYNKKILKLFNLEIYIQKDIEIKKTRELLNERQINDEIDRIILQKMKPIIGKDGIIKEKKLLKKSSKNSKIEMELFIVANEEISYLTIPE